MEQTFYEISQDKAGIALINALLKDGIKNIHGYKQDTREIEIVCKNGATITFYHEQNCCEDVRMIDSEALGNQQDIYTNAQWGRMTAESCNDEDALESATWTYIKFTTDLGYDTWRWYGESNGWYSEDVDCVVNVPQDLLKNDTIALLWDLFNFNTHEDE